MAFLVWGYDDGGALCIGSLATQTLETDVRLINLVLVVVVLWRKRSSCRRCSDLTRALPLQHGVEGVHTLAL